MPSKLILGSVAFVLGLAVLLCYPKPAAPQGFEPQVEWVERKNCTYSVRQSFLLRNPFNSTVAELVYVSLPVNASWQSAKLTSSTWRPLRISIDEEGNPICTYNLSLGAGSLTWLNVTLEVTVERYNLRIVGAPWPSLSDVENRSNAKRFWPVENQTYVSIAKEIAPSSADPMAASSAIGRWILDRLQYEVMPRRGGEHALLLEGNKLVLRGDCEEVADVFVTLARTLGIRARVAHGMLLLSHDESMWVRRTSSGFDTSDNWGGHAWPQVYVEPVGWVDVELLEGPSVKIGDFSESHLKYNFEERKFMGSTLSNYCLTGFLEVDLMYFTFKVI